MLNDRAHQRIIDGVPDTGHTEDAAADKGRDAKNVRHEQHKVAADKIGEQVKPEIANAVADFFA